jgi:hypothetical protein
MPAVVFVREFRSPENSSYRVQSPRIAASSILFAQTADGAALARAKGDTVKNPKTPFLSKASTNRCDVAKPPPNFPYRRGLRERKIAAPAKPDDGRRGGRRGWAPSTSQSGGRREAKNDQSERRGPGLCDGSRARGTMAYQRVLSFSPRLDWRSRKLDQLFSAINRCDRLRRIRLRISR